MTQAALAARDAELIDWVPHTTPADPPREAAPEAAAAIEGRFNLAGAKVLILDRSEPCVDLLSSVLMSFGSRDHRRCTRVQDAQGWVQSGHADLLIVDPTMEDGAGYEFVRWLRRSNIQPGCYAPVICVVGHARASELARMRDVGANFLIAKPIAPKVLLQRILWVARAPRLFVSKPTYIGPDRRFRDEGPPLGQQGRRAEDRQLDI